MQHVEIQFCRWRGASAKQADVVQSGVARETKAPGQALREELRSYYLNLLLGRHPCETNGACYPLLPEAFGFSATGRNRRSGRRQADMVAEKERECEAL